MESLEKMYFSESIAKRHHKRIRKQLETGNIKMKKDIHPIVMRKSGPNLFQFIELKDFITIHNATEDYLLIGAVKDFDEFLKFVELFFNLLIKEQIEIEKNGIINYLKGWNYDRL